MYLLASITLLSGLSTLLLLRLALLEEGLWDEDLVLGRDRPEWIVLVGPRMRGTD